MKGDFFMLKVIAVVVIATIIGIVAMTFIPQLTNNNNGGDPTQLVDDHNNLTIGISGQVVKPGNYILEPDSTLQDLIDKAGGVNSNADERCYYLDLTVEEDAEYYIAPKNDLSDICGDEPLEKVNINDASKEQLMTISGIGDGISDQIIAHREENGIFYCLEDLMDVSGIGNATFEKLKDSIYLHE